MVKQTKKGNKMTQEENILYNGFKIWKWRNNQFKTKSWTYYIYQNDKLITLKDYGKYNFYPKNLNDCKYLIDNFLTKETI